jgi:hypothetical protein
MFHGGWAVSVHAGPLAMSMTAAKWDVLRTRTVTCASMGRFLVVQSSVFARIYPTLVHLAARLPGMHIALLCFIGKSAVYGQDKKYWFFVEPLI